MSRLDPDDIAHDDEQAYAATAHDDDIRQALLEDAITEGYDPETGDLDDAADLAVPCPYCGHHTLYRPDGWTDGGPIACGNPYCDSNHPPAGDDG